MSSCLVWQHMSPQQRTAWLANVQQLADRGEQLLSWLDASQMRRSLWHKKGPRARLEGLGINYQTDLEPHSDASTFLRQLGAEAAMLPSVSILHALNHMAARRLLGLALRHPQSFCIPDGAERCRFWYDIEDKRVQNKCDSSYPMAAGGAGYCAPALYMLKEDSADLLVNSLHE